MMSSQQSPVTGLGDRARAARILAPLLSNTRRLSEED